jgi:hypothetical protein
MPRKTSENTEALNVRIPPSWNKRAEKLAAAAEPAHTRTAILRAAIGYGLDVMEQKQKHGKKKAASSE